MEITAAHDLDDIMNTPLRTTISITFSTIRIQIKKFNIKGALNRWLSQTEMRRAATRVVLKRTAQPIRFAMKPSKFEENYRNIDKPDMVSCAMRPV